MEKMRRRRSYRKSNRMASASARHRLGERPQHLAQARVGSAVELSTAASTARHQYGMSSGEIVVQPSVRARPTALASCRRERAESLDDCRPALGSCGRDERARETVDLGDGLPRPKSRVARRRTQRRAASAVSASPASRCASVCGRSFELEQTLRERDQRAGEVAAVDGRDVARVQRRRVSPCRTSSESVPDIARDPPASSAWRSGGERARRSSR